MPAGGLLVHDLLESSRVNGPGLRAVLWVQGCSIGCRECCNPQMRSPAAGRPVAVADLLDRLIRLPDIEGVTISGGEPFDQAGPLAVLGGGCRRAGLGVVAYTGHRFERLRDEGSAEVRAFLVHIDLLIDGPYIAGPVAPGWRGSANQRLVFLSDRYLAYAEAPERLPEPEVEVHLRPDGRAVVTGFPTAEMLASLKDLLSG